MSPFRQGILVLLLFLEYSEAKSNAGTLKGCFLHIIYAGPAGSTPLSPLHQRDLPKQVRAEWCTKSMGCRSYEDCCGSRCCVRSLSIQRLWYFWFLLMMGVLLCCGAGFFIRRRMYPSPLVDETTYNVSFTRPLNSNTPGVQQPGMAYYTDPEGIMINPTAMSYHVQPKSPQMNQVYPPPPSYCNTPPPSYEQAVKCST